MPRAIVWLPGDSTAALASQGPVSVSPMPVMPSSVWTSTTTSSCDEDVASSRKSGATSTIHSTSVIFIFRSTKPLSRLRERGRGEGGRLWRL